MREYEYKTTMELIQASPNAQFTVKPPDGGDGWELHHTAPAGDGERMTYTWRRPKTDGRQRLED